MYNKILVTVDLGDAQQSDKAVKTAVELARTFDTALYVMTVVPDFGMSIVGSFFPPGFESDAIDQGRIQLEKYCAENIPKDMDLHLVVGHGTIYEEIITSAKKSACDLIVMASHRPELKDYLLGPNTARVVRHANVSVMVIR